MDSKKQIAIWKEAQKEVLKKLAAYPICVVKSISARKSYVDWGYKPLMTADGPKASENTQILNPN